MQILSLLAVVSLTSAAALPDALLARGPGECCFTLQDGSGNTLQQATSGPNSGDAFIGSSHPNGSYCLDVTSTSRGILYDKRKAACIVDSWGTINCVDGTPGGVKWSLNTKKELVYGGSTDFSVCDGGQVYGGKVSRCRAIKLKATGATGTC